MTKEECKKIAHKRYVDGKIKKEDVSYCCFRKNELMKEQRLDHSSAWDKAKSEAKSIYFK